MLLLSLILSLVIWGFIFYLLFWALGQMALTEPFAKAIKVLLVIGAVVVIIGLLTGSVAPFYFLSSIGLR
jgi:hypothetical protein